MRWHHGTELHESQFAYVFVWIACLFVCFLTDKPKVAFSAALFGHGGQTVGGYSTEEILKFMKVFTNIGGAYSHTTGTILLLDHSISEIKLAIAALSYSEWLR